MIIIAILLLAVIVGLSVLGYLSVNQFNRFEDTAGQLSDVIFSPPRPLAPARMPTVAGWSYQGCYYDQAKRRVIKDNSIQDSSLTNQRCAEHCRDYVYFGTENGESCFCGNRLGFQDIAPEWVCMAQCKGNSDDFEVCGGYSALGLWGKNGEIATQLALLLD